MGREGEVATEELPGDRLIRQLAAALAPAPSEVRPYAIPAAALFCPDCVAGRTCTFHRPTTLGWNANAPPTIANLAHSFSGPLGDSNSKGECWPAKAQTDARRPLPTMPNTGSLSALPVPSPCTEAMPVPRGLVCAPGATCAPGAWHCPDERREKGSKGAELDDTSTDVESSEPCHAESDASDPSPESASSTTHRWRGQHRSQEAHCPLPYKSAVSTSSTRTTLKQRVAGRGAPARWLCDLGTST